jgi:hypothetical protein
MWAFPFLNFVVLAAFLAVIGGMVFSDSSRESLVMTLVIAIIAGLIRQRTIRADTRGTDPEQGPAVGPTSGAGDSDDPRAAIQVRRGSLT